MYEDIAALFAKRFVQRRDVKAVQMVVRDKVIYVPDSQMNYPGVHGPLGFRMDHLTNHIAGLYTYGHYLLDTDDNCRMFCFDIDLKANDDNFTGYYIPMTPFDPETMTDEIWEAMNAPIPFDPRASWRDRAHASRQWTKMQFGDLARKLTSTIVRELDLPCAAAYSGNKGIHVYGFTGPMPASDVRKAAKYILESTGDWELERGEHIYRYKVQDPFLGFPNINLELYPKQDTLESKDLGNLLRLPLGKNLKAPDDPTFFLDLNTPVGVMAPHPNPVRLLESGNPFSE